MTIRRVLLWGVLGTPFFGSCDKRAAVSDFQNHIQGVGESHPILPIGFLDAPKPGTSVSKASNTLQLMGWAVSESGIDSVSVYVDRTFLTDAKINLARPDVEKAYPNMPGAPKAGWWASLPLASVGPGVHNVLVQLKANSGAIRDLDVFVDVRP